ncbi:NAD(P)/FAD-dependent oxidoreductase [Caulobacter sp. RHG1]|uniref:NAD(P)/FAD-dependent oxidoreductase n=1 Tax=Caulobacter sp. (strain RHG1) TaxID=2545762 RepID=UPI001552B522|nr:NAD(P)/FAD-dependent oxidoreductase [Caulobacter sp. RHG1]NQE64325.1 Thioredoxin reductase [Caulobacter sp. RHG1]
MSEPIDCVIIGAGPAGLVAALYLLRFRRSVLIAERGDSRATMIPRSHNYPGFPEGIGGLDLLRRLQRQMLPYGKPEWGGEVLGLEADGHDWRVIFKGRLVHARTVLLATGVRDRWPQLLDAQAALQQGVLRFCPICDGFEAINKRVAVIGDGDHAAREALFLRRYSPSVTLLSDGGDLSAAMAVDLRQAGVAVEATRQGSLRFAGGAVWASDPQGRDLDPFDAVYGALGVDPQTRLLASLDLALDAGGCAIVDGHQRLSRPGLYAAGDVVRGLNQISVAVGEAAIAATAIHNALRERAVDLT